jgi:hypothetical protein
MLNFWDRFLMNLVTAAKMPFVGGCEFAGEYWMDADGDTHVKIQEDSASGQPR